MEQEGSKQNNQVIEELIIKNQIVERLTIKELTKEVRKTHQNNFSFSVLCGIFTAIIIIAWVIFIFCFNKAKGTCDALFYDFLLTSFAHIAFLGIAILGCIITYKTFKIQSETKVKKEDFERKKELECLQKEKYEQAKIKKEEEADFDKKVEDACATILKKWEDAYNENLKTLKSNMGLYNEVKKIVEGDVQVKGKEDIISSK